MRRRLTDPRGNCPNFVIDGQVLRHQPSGLEEALPQPTTPRQVRKAYERLKARVRTYPARHIVITTGSLSISPDGVTWTKLGDIAPMPEYK